MGADCVMKYYMYQSHWLLPGVVSTFFYNIIIIFPLTKVGV